MDIIDRAYRIVLNDGSHYDIIPDKIEEAINLLEEMGWGDDIKEIQTTYTISNENIK